MIGFYESGVGLPTGTYYVTASKTDYINELYDNLSCPESYCDVRTGTPVSVIAGNTTSGIDFALEEGGSISGKVTDLTSGLPISDVDIEIYDAYGNWIDYFSTDSNGNYFSPQSYATGLYYARTSNSLHYLNEIYDNLACTGSCNPLAGTPVSVAQGSNTPNIDLSFE